MLSLDEALALSRTLAGLLVILQTLEILAVRRTLAPGGVFGPDFAAADQAALGAPLRGALAWTRGYGPFVGLLVARLFLATGWWIEAGWGVGALGSVLVAGALLVTQVAVSVRFGGSFNGGSDGMSLVVLLGLFVAALPHERAGMVGLGYIAAQSTLSYLIAGLVKIREPDWRSGRALTAFFHARRYGVDPRIRGWLGEPAPARALSWAVMLFECAFPAAFFSPGWMCVATALGLAFHLGNWWVFGLNRFVWAWAATYPSLIFVASLVAARP